MPKNSNKKKNEQQQRIIKIKKQLTELIEGTLCGNTNYSERFAVNRNEMEFK